MVLIRKRWLLNPLFSSAVLVVCVNQGLSETSGISGISIRTGQLFLCGYTTAGSLLIAPDTQPNISRYRPPVKDSVVSVGLCSSAPTQLQTSYHFSALWAKPISLGLNHSAFPQTPEMLRFHGGHLGARQFLVDNRGKRLSAGTFECKFSLCNLLSEFRDGRVSQRLTMAVLKKSLFCRGPSPSLSSSTLKALCLGLSLIE